MRAQQKQGGFTLVELIVVIIILGILSAVALPKFMNVTEEAHEAAVAGVGGAFAAAVTLVHAQYMANGLTGAQDNIAGFGNDDVDVNANGWPVSTNDRNGNPNNNRCRQVWEAVLQGPPTVHNQVNRADYRATATGGVCTFSYQLGGDMSIAYNVSDGSVTVDSTF